MRLIDAHCHLIDDKLWSDVKSVVQEAFEAGVTKMITMGGGERDWPRLTEIVEKFDNVYVAFGWHPEDIEEVVEIAGVEEMIKKTKRCVAVGEVGLDFYYYEKEKYRDMQIEMLEKQIELSKRLKKPVVIHVRQAEEEMMAILRKYGSTFRGHFHCYGESERLLDQIIELGHVVSFGGNVTFKSAQNLRDMARRVPANQLLLETDAPYLSPEPKRGMINRPAHLIYTAQIIARERKISMEELAESSYHNTICFFGLEN
jgi:TatD DNase family protein